MTKAEFDKLFDSILEEVKGTRSAGQKEYAHGEVDDVFNNFNRVASSIELDRKKVLFTYLSKHIDGVTAYIKGHKSQREDVRGRIKDIMVYCALLWGMIEEEERELKVEGGATFGIAGSKEDYLPQVEINQRHFGLGKRDDLAHDR